MNVEIVDDRERFAALGPAWNCTFKADPIATVFLSWPWLRGWIDVTSERWCVLAVREPMPSDSQELARSQRSNGRAAAPCDPCDPCDQHGSRERYVGFLPLSIRSPRNRMRVDQCSELHAIAPNFADYTGLVCLPGHEEMVLETLAHFLTDHVRWDRLVLRDVNDSRINHLLAHLPFEAVDFENARGLCSPFIPLPGTWDDFLCNQLTPPMRKAIRKAMRVLDGGEYHVTQLQPGDDPKADIDRLMALAAHRPVHQDDPTLGASRLIFEHCAAAGLVSIVTLWHGETPVAAQGSFVDAKHRSLRVYLAGFDDRFASISPGRVLDAWCIRNAIERGFHEVDLLRGDEPYKFRLGAQRRYTRDVRVTRRSVGTAARLAVNRLRDALRI
jgi:CelD/BcsL family acetyltransferase involved in cellulose biosynthesis